MLISIHSLRMEGDREKRLCHHSPQPFQSTPSAWRETPEFQHIPKNSKFQSTPSAWRETHRTYIDSKVMFIFQSTPSAWRETPSLGRKGQAAENFNPLPPHGGRPLNRALVTLAERISIHSLRMEGDDSICETSGTVEVFQSTPSAWRETLGKEITADDAIISIHSLRMEGDSNLAHVCGT